MKVTQVTPQKKNPKRFNIYLDGQFAFGADEDLIIKFRLLPGKEVSPTDLEKLLYESEVGKLMGRMYGLFSVRARSEREIRDYLRRLSFKRKVRGDEEVSELIVGTLIERLKEKGLINDLEFARSWVESRRRSKKKGNKVLKMELIQKGIEQRMADDVLSDGEVDEAKLASEALEKKLRVWKSLEKWEFRKKATDYLLRKGFEYSTIKKVLEDWV